MKEYRFGLNQWDQEEFRYAYSPLVRPGAVFTQEAHCIVNQPSDAKEKFEYISLLCNQKQKSGVRLQTHCSFEVMGAPLIVFSDDLKKDENGLWRYGLHYEIVAYEGGINVWQIVPEGNTAVPTKLLGDSFPVDPKITHCLRASIWKDRLEIMLDDHIAAVKGSFPETFFVGFTACEGINRFYDFSIDS